MPSLILGSSGQVGSALFDYLERKGEKPIPFDIARDAGEDLRQPNSRVNDAIAAADFVYFLAFDVGGSVYLSKFQDTFDFVHNNTRLMASTFGLLARHKKPFIFASSQMSNMSFSNYGLLKAVGERYTAALGGLTVKFWNVYGVEHDPEKTHVITDFLEMARTARKIAMRTSGKEERQFLYSEDCAECLRTLATRYAEIPRDKELHITNFAWNSILQVAAIVADIYPGTEIVPAQASDLVQVGVRNEPDPYILRYWQPKTSLRQGMEQIARRL